MEDCTFDMADTEEPNFDDMTDNFSPYTEEPNFDYMTDNFSPYTEEPNFGDMTDNFSPYTQEPIFEGSYVIDENVAMSCFGDYTDPAYQNPEQYLEYPPYPENPADLHQSQEDEQSSQYRAPRRPCGRGYRPPPKYTAPRNVANRYGPPRSQGMQATRQQPACRAPTANNPRQATRQQPAYPAPTENYPRQGTTQQPSYPAPTANYPRPVVPTYPPPATGQWVVAQPQGFRGQAPVVIVQPLLQYPPNDYMGYSIFACLCCCWIIGLVAIFKSFECRRAIDVGNHELAKKKSKGARNSAHAALALGILAYIVAGFIIGI